MHASVPLLHYIYGLIYMYMYICPRVFYAWIERIFQWGIMFVTCRMHAPVLLLYMHICPCVYCVWIERESFSEELCRMHASVHIIVLYAIYMDSYMYMFLCVFFAWIEWIFQWGIMFVTCRMHTSVLLLYFSKPAVVGVGTHAANIAKKKMRTLEKCQPICACISSAFITL